ncbi:hypothetical protein HDU67_007459 [Dinochytrium kinnereticum]|nr:hypothetical protein HDU67_007459 [Dinochytrium kinnereticum]
MVAAAHSLTTFSAASLVLFTVLITLAETLLHSIVSPILFFAHRRPYGVNRKITAERAELLRMLSLSGNARPRAVDRLSLQPAELTLKMLAYLPSEDLARISEVNTHLFRLSNEDCLWKARCEEQWEGKKHQTMKLHPRVDYCYIVGKLTEEEMKDVLARRFVKKLTEGFSRGELEEKLASTVPEDSFVPFYSGKWKASYIAAEMDQHRSVITRDEVMAYEWIFTDFWGYSMSNDESDEIRVKFWPDGTRSNVNKEKKYSRPRPQPWHMNEKGGIQVSQFPEHSLPSRTDDWGWTFSNGTLMSSSFNCVPFVYCPTNVGFFLILLDVRYVTYTSV